MIKNQASTHFPTTYGQFTLYGFQFPKGKDYLALVTKDLDMTPPVLLRIHSECTTGDVFTSQKCDCGQQLDSAMKKIAAEGGVLIYSPDEGRGIGLFHKVQAYHLQDTGLDTVEANRELGFKDDYRTYTQEAEILQALGIADVHLLTNNPKKVEGLQKAGITVSQRVPLIIQPNEHNKFYMETKKAKMGHLFDF